VEPLAVIQLVIGIGLVVMGIAKRPISGWGGFVLVGVALTWSAVWSVFGAVAMTFRLSVVLIAMVVVLVNEAIKRPERLRDMWIEVVLGAVAILALFSSEFVFAPHSDSQTIALGALVVAYFGMLAAFSIRMVVRFRHSPRG
jgi:hypothetical protein